jgi:hypothetical protein
VWRAIKRWEPLYWLRTHTYNRYHIINISGQGGYKWGWVDRDHAMFLACFTILDEFMTTEYPGYVDWKADPETRKVNTELHLLHFWWKHQRQREQDEVYALHHNMWEWARKQRKAAEDTVDFNAQFSTMDDHPMREEYWNMYEWLEKRDQEMLKRLIAVREWMWT